MKKLAVVLLAFASLTACKKKAADKGPDTTAGSGSAGGNATANMPADAADMGSGSAGSAAAAAWDGKTPFTVTEGVQTPESVLYDADSDVYLVSNINGAPLDADDNGYIMRISP